MFLIVQVVLWALVAAFAVILLVLVTPLRLELQVSRETAFRFSAALRPFGRFGPRISLSDGQTKPRPKKPERKKKARRGFGKMRPKQFAQAAIRLAVDLIGLVRVEAASLELRFGLGDPAETGQIYGQMTPLIYGTSGVSRVDVTVEPLFDQAALTGRAALDLSLVPLRLVPPFARFGWAAFGPAR
ncbi:MAG: DUF2953 domain-containing protein [Silicimonas sp.]|nr:DUF2953 domain-containing protein [Silicimonas sp.]